MRPDPKTRLGESLVKEGLITGEQLQLALEEQKKSGGSMLLGHVLLKMSLVDEERLAKLLSQESGIEYVDLTAVVIPPDVVKLVPEDLVRRYSCVPLAKKGRTLIVAMVNPQDTFVIDELRKTLGWDIEPRIATAAGIRYVLERRYEAKAELKEIITSVEKDTDGERHAQIAVAEAAAQALADDAPAIKLVNQLLVDAVKDEASDVHIEPGKAAVSVRFRIDGILHDLLNLPKHMQEAIVSRIKIMSNLDIAEKRVPQDGKLRMSVDGKEIDVRVSIYPLIYGQKAVMSLLHQSSLTLGLEKLGFDEESLATFTALIHKPYGIILVTGPTGSGKTTTLYSALETIKSRASNVVTIEDPVEYELEGIQQSQVNPKAGLTFAVLLRALMRQDPDVILVGEIRDGETAEVAIRSALTGHLVFSTLHTNDAPSSVARLIDMGIEPFLVASSTVGIMAQRLVRGICPKCKEPCQAAPSLESAMGLPAGSVLYRGAGCESCYGTGYKGRLGVFEMLLIDDELRELIGRRVAASELRALARQRGMRTLREDAVQKALKGLVPLEEVERVTEKE